MKYHIFAENNTFWVNDTDVSFFINPHFSPIALSPVTHSAINNVHDFNSEQEPLWIWTPFYGGSLLILVCLGNSLIFRVGAAKLGWKWHFLGGKNWYWMSCTAPMWRVFLGGIFTLIFEAKKSWIITFLLKISLVFFIPLA